MPHKKKIFCFLIPSILLTLFLLTVWIITKKEPFRNFCDTIFVEELQGDTLSLHYTLACPEKYNIDTERTSLPLYSVQNALSNYKKTQTYYDKLQTFLPEDLSNNDLYTHTLLTKSLSHELDGRQYFYLQEVFSPSSGTQIQFPILMAEYPFRCKKDIQDYLELIKLTPTYFSSLCQFEQEKFSKGFGMPDYSLNKVIDQCNTIITEDSLLNNEHFLITTFSERILQAVNDKIITKKEASSFASQNRQYLASYFLPAYENLATSLSSFCGMGNNEAGLSHYADGSDYYEWLFCSITGSEICVKDAYQTLAQDYYNSRIILEKSLHNFQKKNTLTYEDLSYFPLSTSEEMLEHLQKRMTEDFPSSSSISLSATVKKVSPAMEDFTAPAYYLLPPLDDNSQNSIYINEASVPNGLQLYTTLGHEGYPGHLYQTTFYQNYRDEQDLPHLRSILNYGGYVEGWALYTEFLAYDYAADLLVEDTGKEDYRLLYNIYATERKASLALLSLLDIGIHYYGMDFERTKKLLADHGITNEDTCREIFEYIVEEPGNYPKYYWGYMEILSLKDTAKEQMGEYYSDYAFHQFFLENGPSDFSTLTQKLKEE